MPRRKEEETVTAAIAKSMPVVTGLRCETCGQLHDADHDTFIVIAGNVMLGTKTPIFGSNLDERGKLVKSTVLCRKMSCCKELLEKIEVAGTAKSATK